MTGASADHTLCWGLGVGDWCGSWVLFRAYRREGGHATVGLLPLPLSMQILMLILNVDLPDLGIWFSALPRVGMVAASNLV